MGYGVTTKNPWPKVKFDPDDTSTDWGAIFKTLRPKESDPFQAAADFYLLFGIVNGSFVAIRKDTIPPLQSAIQAASKLGLSLEDMEWRNQYLKEVKEFGPWEILRNLTTLARIELVARVDYWDEQFSNYIELACGGEIRHHQAIGNVVLSGIRKTAWTQWPRVVALYGIESTYTTMSNLFDEFNTGSFGGRPWAIAAELIRDRLLERLGPTAYLNKQMFVDRVFTLQHNGGCFLNKLDWANFRMERGLPYSEGIGAMPATVLAFQASNPPNIEGLWKYASYEAQEIVKQFLDTASAYNLEINGTWDPAKNLSSAGSTGDLITGSSTKNHVTFIQGATHDAFIQGSPTVTHYCYGDGCPELLITTGKSGGVSSGAIDYVLDVEPSCLDALCHTSKTWTVAISCRITANGITDWVDVTKTYTEEELMDKKFHWKHFTKKKYPGATPDSITITFTSPELRVTFDTIESPCKAFKYVKYAEHYLSTT